MVRTKPVLDGASGSAGGGKERYPWDASSTATFCFKAFMFSTDSQQGPKRPGGVGASAGWLLSDPITICGEPYWRTTPHTASTQLRDPFFSTPTG